MPKKGKYSIGDKLGALYGELRGQKKAKAAKEDQLSKYYKKKPRRYLSKDVSNTTLQFIAAGVASFSYIFQSAAMQEPPLVALGIGAVGACSIAALCSDVDVIEPVLNFFSPIEVKHDKKDQQNIDKLQKQIIEHENQIELIEEKIDAMKKEERFYRDSLTPFQIMTDTVKSRSNRCSRLVNKHLSYLVDLEMQGKVASSTLVGGAAAGAGMPDKTEIISSFLVEPLVEGVGCFLSPAYQVQINKIINDGRKIAFKKSDLTKKKYTDLDLVHLRKDIEYLLKIEVLYIYQQLNNAFTKTSIDIDSLPTEDEVRKADNACNRYIAALKDIDATLTARKKAQDKKEGSKKKETKKKGAKKQRSRSPGGKLASRPKVFSELLSVKGEAPTETHTETPEAEEKPKPTEKGKKPEHCLTTDPCAYLATLWSTDQKTGSQNKGDNAKKKQNKKPKK